MSVYTNGPELPIYIKSPLAMSKVEADAFEDLVLKGDEVDPHGLRQRIESASFLAYALDGERMVAVGAIKRPSQHHKADIAARSGVGLDSYRGELGWLYVECDHRKGGLGSRITEALLGAFADPVYSTTRTDNAKVHGLMQKFNFRRAGRDWPSHRRPEISLCLWIPRREADK